MVSGRIILEEMLHDQESCLTFADVSMRSLQGLAGLCTY